MPFVVLTMVHPELVRWIRAVVAVSLVASLIVLVMGILVPVGIYVASGILSIAWALLRAVLCLIGIVIIAVIALRWRF